MNIHPTPDYKGLRKFSAYSDESGCFSERYQAIGIISGEKKHLCKLRDELASILQNKEVSEVKFSEVRTHRPKIEAAKSFVKKSVDFAKQRNIRIDVLLWDTHDERHSIPGRDDLANLERMYYKVLRHISEKWHQNNWELYPDNGSKINWHKIKSYLSCTRTPRQKLPNLLTLFEEERYNIIFHKIEQKKSHDEPLIQVADLFAGMACFCREGGEECVNYLQSQKKSNQQLLFEYDEPEVGEDPSKTKRNRFELVGYLNELCKRHSLGVSLDTKRYLDTPDPLRFINFWNYKSQYKEDKAPVKLHRRS